MLKLTLIGALTSKPFAFTFRSWEVTAKKYVDFLDILALNVLFETRQHKIIRVLPLFSYQTPKNIWLSDRIRHFLPNFNKYRLYRINFLYKLSERNLSKKQFLAINHSTLSWFLDCFFKNDNIIKNFDIVSNTASFQSIFRIRNMLFNNRLNKNLNKFLSFSQNSSAKNTSLSNYFSDTRFPFNFISYADLAYLGLDLRKISPTFFIYLQTNLQTNNRLLLTFLTKISKYSAFYLAHSVHGGSHFKYFVEFFKGRHLLFNYTYLSSLTFHVFCNYDLIFLKPVLEQLKNKFKTFLDNTNFVPNNLGLITKAELGLDLSCYTINFQYNAKFLENKIRNLTTNVIENSTTNRKTHSNILYLEEPDNINFDNLYYDFVIFCGSYWHPLAYEADFIVPKHNFLELHSQTFLSFTGFFKTTTQIYSVLPKYTSDVFSTLENFYQYFNFKFELKLTEKLFVFIERAGAVFSKESYTLRNTQNWIFLGSFLNTISNRLPNIFFSIPLENLFLPYQYAFSSDIITYKNLVNTKSIINFDSSFGKFYSL